MTDLMEQLRHANPEPASEAPPTLRRRLLERTASGVGGSRWTDRRRMVLGTTLATLVACGGATAAVVALHGAPSEPSSGPIPGAARGQADRYRISVTPNTVLGSSGWCVSTSTSVGTEQATVGEGCTQAPHVGTLLVGGGIFLLSSSRALVYYLVDSRVAAARLNNDRVVEATSDPGLPSTMRLVAATVRAQAYHVDPGYLRVQLLAADGKPLAGQASSLQDLPRQERPTRGLASSAADAACRLTAADAGVSLHDARTVPQATLDRATGYAFLSCATATAKVGGASIEVVVLADPAGGGAPPAVNTAAGFDTHDAAVQRSAQRIDGGWLVVKGGTREQRRETLTRLVAEVRR